MYHLRNRSLVVFLSLIVSIVISLGNTSQRQIKYGVKSKIPVIPVNNGKTIIAFFDTGSFISGHHWVSICSSVCPVGTVVWVTGTLQLWIDSASYEISSNYIRLFCRMSGRETWHGWELAWRYTGLLGLSFSCRFSVMTSILVIRILILLFSKMLSTFSCFIIWWKKNIFAVWILKETYFHLLFSVVKAQNMPIRYLCSSSFVNWLIGVRIFLSFLFRSCGWDRKSWDYRQK